MTVNGPDGRPRCDWGASWADPLYLAYHDQEWGVPVRDERHLLEFVILEGAQSGLSWSTILHRRNGYQRAFAGFDPEIVARFGPEDVERLMADPGIIRNRAKVNAAIANARAALALRDAGTNLVDHLWSFVGGHPIVNQWVASGQAPAATAESTAMSRDLKRRGFAFVGPTVCYAIMQATGNGQRPPGRLLPLARGPGGGLTLRRERRCAAPDGPPAAVWAWRRRCDRRPCRL